MQKNNNKFQVNSYEHLFLHNSNTWKLKIRCKIRSILIKIRTFDYYFYKDVGEDPCVERVTELKKLIIFWLLSRENNRPSDSSQRQNYPLPQVQHEK